MKLVMLVLKRHLHGPLWRQDTNGQLSQASATEGMYLKLHRVGSLIWHGEQLDTADCQVQRKSRDQIILNLYMLL